VYGQVALLQRHGVRPPQVAMTFHRMREAGLDVDRVPVRLREGRARLRAYAPAPDASISAAPAPDPPPSRSRGAVVDRSASSPAPLISVRDLHYTYPNGTTALSGVGLDVYPGEYVAIVGQNGAGKSTLVKHFLNVLAPAKGAVLVGGVDAGTLKTGELARRIGYVAQNPDSQIFNSTVAAEVAFALEALGYDRDEVDARVAESLRSMGLLAVRDRHPLSLPKGDRARVVIAAVLAMAPDVMVFDEPTTGQDYEGARHVLDVSRRLHDEGRTVMVITHHLHLLPGYAERVVVMGEGTILLDADIRTVFGAGELLRATYLAPPQVVLLAQTLGLGEGRSLPLTPEELVGALVQGRSAL
jgi:energy-coupling factor transport system ATP-binding protein